MYKRNETAYSPYSDITCGLHSNMPLCCVLFFNDVWASIREKIPECGVNEVKQHRDHFCALNWFHHEGEYICCPTCGERWMRTKQKSHIVKDCDCLNSFCRCTTRKEDSDYAMKPEIVIEWRK